MLLEDWVGKHARERGELEAIRDESRTVNFQELGQEVDALVLALVQLGLGAEDRVAVLSKNRIEYACLYFAVARIGAVLVPLNWRLRSLEVESLLADSGAKALFIEPEFADELLSARERLSKLAHWVGLDDIDGTADRYSGLVSSLEISKTPQRSSPCDAQQVAVQMYTSGTTGLPKGALLTTQNIDSMTTSWLEEISLRQGRSRFLQVTPLFHVGGMLMLCSNVRAGTTLVLHREFQPDAALVELARSEITHALFVPAMIQWLLLESGDEPRRFPALQLVIYGASPISTGVLQSAMELFDCDFLQGYGLTETAGVLTVLRPDDHRLPPGPERDARLLSAGQAIGCSEVRLVDDAGEVVGVGEIGEIVARGSNICAGYWGRSDAEDFRGGWFHTGDLARMDQSGFITVVDRKKDMILVGGENVYPKEIEAVLSSHSDVLDSCVIGIPHEVWGEEVLAFVALSEGSRVSSRELIRACRERLARYKCPTRLEITGEIPRNAAGKLVKRELRERYWSDRERRV